MKMTTFESLPNEIIYVLFEYLPIHDIFGSLSQLNSRYDTLIAQYVHFVIDFRSVRKYIYDEALSQIIPSQTQSLYLSNKRPTYGQIDHFFNRFSLESFGLRLCSLSLKSCSSQTLKCVIDAIPSLKILARFVFEGSASVEYDHNIRQSLVLALTKLPLLERCTIKIYNEELTFDQDPEIVFPSLKYLFLRLSSLNQVVHVCRQAPQLTHLKIGAIFQSTLTVTDCSSLSQLRCLSIRTSATMDELERLLSSARSLRSFSILCSLFEVSDAHRWQCLISKIHPLRFRFVFLIEFSASIDPAANPFDEKFWVQRTAHVRLSQETTGLSTDVFSLPPLVSSLVLDETVIYSVHSLPPTNTINPFEEITELYYSGYNADRRFSSLDYFPKLRHLILETDMFPPSSLVCLDHVEELRLTTPLTEELFKNVSLPTLKRLVLDVLPLTWSVLMLTGGLESLKTRLMCGVIDHVVQEMCATTSFVLLCKHICVHVNSISSVNLILNKLTCLESAHFTFPELGSTRDFEMVEQFFRGITHLRNFHLTTYEERPSFKLWIDRKNSII